MRSFDQPVANPCFLEAAKMFGWTVSRVHSYYFRRRSEELFKAVLVQFAHCIQQVSVHDSHYCYYTVDALLAIAGCRQLRQLEVSCKNMNNTVLYDLGLNCLELRDICFLYSQTSEHHMTLEGLCSFHKKCQNLPTFLLDCAFIDRTVVPIDIIKVLMAASGLRVLVPGFGIGENYQFAESPPKRYLEVLTIKNDRNWTGAIDDDVLKCLAGAFRSIDHLCLEHFEKVSDAGFIYMIQKLAINQLFLNNFTGITSASLHAIVEHCPLLHEIEIEYSSQLVIDLPLLSSMLEIRSLKRIAFHRRRVQDLVQIITLTASTIWKTSFEDGDHLEYLDNRPGEWVIVVIERRVL